MITLRRCSSVDVRGLVGDWTRAYGQSVAARRYPQWRSVRAATVLIVADDVVARGVYAELFAMRGYGVVTAADAREGLARARQRRVSVAVLALASGAGQLRRQLQAMRPRLRVHVTGLVPIWLDLAAPRLRQQLH
jgi:CheY-like chemotaxis protein